MSSPGAHVCKVISARTPGTKSGELWFHQGHQGSGSQEECVGQGELCAATSNPDLSVASTITFYFLLPLVAGVGLNFMWPFSAPG